MARIANTVNKSHVLLVEGEADRGFFEQICKSRQLNPKIEVAPPKDYQNDYEQTLSNSKQGVFNLLNDLLPELLDTDADTKRLAIVVDADYELAQGLGYQKTIEQICQLASDYDFSLIENHAHGLCFQHSNETAKFGLWIMPNNQHEGMLEDFIKHCIDANEQNLFNHAVQVVQTVPEPKKFASHHYSKAEVATWLAWQKPPGHGLYWTVCKELLNTDNDLFQELTAWLKHIFT